MPFHPLYVPAGRNQFFSAASLSLLLPTLSDEAIFDDAVEHLFGTIAGRFQRILLSELKSHTIDSMPPSLNGFINSHLRPKLADYIVANKADYLALFDSEASLMAAVDKVRSGAEFLGALEEASLARMMGMNLHLYRGPEDLVPFIKYEHTASASKGCIRLTRDDSTMFNYHYLLEPEELPRKLRRRLFPETIRDASTIVRELYVLCTLYLEETRFSRPNKRTVVSAMQHAQSPQEMLERLNAPCEIAGYPSLSRKDFLLRPEMDWRVQVLVGFVMIVTFPLSIPLWLLFTWAESRWEALASKERILVRQIIALCTEKAASDVLTADDVDDKHSSLNIYNKSA